MNWLRGGALVAWTNAWLGGAVGSDDVLHAVTGDDAPHRVVGLDAEDPELAQPLSALLIAWRRTGEPARLVLPVAGDTRGLRGPASFRTSALEAGEAVVCGALGCVPEIVDYYPSSAPTEVTWRAAALEPGPADYLGVGDAQFELAAAIRDAASALSAAQVSGGSGDVLAALGSARRAGDQVRLPPGFPARAVALVSQAQRLDAVLQLAHADPSGGAVDRMGLAARASALAPLTTAVRRALLAGYNATAEA